MINIDDCQAKTESDAAYSKRINFTDRTVEQLHLNHKWKMSVVLISVSAFVQVL